MKAPEAQEADRVETGEAAQPVQYPESRDTREGCAADIALLSVMGRWGSPAGIQGEGVLQT